MTPFDPRKRRFGKNNVLRGVEVATPTPSFFLRRLPGTQIRGSLSLADFADLAVPVGRDGVPCNSHFYPYVNVVHFRLAKIDANLWIFR